MVTVVLGGRSAELNQRSARLSLSILPNIFVTVGLVYGCTPPFLPLPKAYRTAVCCPLRGTATSVVDDSDPDAPQSCVEGTFCGANVTDAGGKDNCPARWYPQGRVEVLRDVKALLPLRSATRFTLKAR